MMHLLYRSLFVLILVLLIPQTGLGQQTIIRGTIPGGEMTPVALNATKDYISFSSEVLAHTTTDQQGRFEMALEVKETRRVMLEIEHYLLTLYIEPEGIYELESDTIDISDELRPLYNLESLPCRIVQEPAPGLNQLISQFNREYNEFISREFGGIYQKRNVNILNEFRKQSEANFQQVENDFLNQYIHYKIAGVVLAMAPAKKPAQYSLLIKNKPVLLNHPEYMAFFHGFYDKQLYPDNRYVSRLDLYSTINYQPDYHALIDSLGKDSTLRNERIRELVCINMLGELFPNPDFSKTNILDLLTFIHLHSKFPDHRDIAHNLSAELKRLEPGYSPPSIVLPDLEGNVVNLADLKGKPVYINFFTTWSFGCLTELELMNDLVQEYKDRIHFISISLDKSPGIVGELKREKSYDWIFLFNGTDKALLRDYRIKTFPVFVLLDEEGRLVEYPAFKPSEIIRESFDRQLKKK